MTHQKKIKELLQSLYKVKTLKKETLSEQILVIVYELGDLAKSASKMRWYSHDNVMYKAYRAEAKKALGDLITQIYLTCENLGLSFEEVREFGFLALQEKIVERKKES